MNRATIPAAALLLASAAALPLTRHEKLELGRLPDPPATVFGKLDSQPLQLFQAVSAAETAVEGGHARRAEIDPDTGGAEVYVYGPEACWLVEVGADGTVLSKRVEPEYMLPGAPVTGDPLQRPSGLLYYELEPGTGASPTHAVTKVQVHYTGWLVDGTQFDSSLDRGIPLVTPLNAVVPGWTEGVGTMRVGGKRKLIIPAALGYGDQGSGDKIPPGAMLVFDIELLGIIDA